MLEKFFKLKENNTDVKTEVLAGLTTFMTMAYILAVNPSILSATGMDAQAILIATALASFVGTALMALFANYPFALAPGMGLNAYFAFTVVLGMGYSWQVALLAVFVEGLIFIVLSLTNVREAIFNSIPMTLKSAVSVGIGLFVGCGILSLVNLLIMLIAPSIFQPMYWIVSLGMFAAVMFITMFDIWNIKRICQTGELSNNLALYCAFTLYVDFIYIFVRILTILARFSNNR